MEKYSSKVKSSFMRRERSVLGGPHSFAIVSSSNMLEPEDFVGNSGLASSSSTETRRSAVPFDWSSGDRSDAMLMILLDIRRLKQCNMADAMKCFHCFESVVSPIALFGI